jgi:hypothetical protein
MRAQFPAGPGGFALTYHHRKADRGMQAPPSGHLSGAGMPEDRLGFDGKRDGI